MNNNNTNDKIKLWAGIVIIILMISPFIIKAVRDDKKPIKDDDIKWSSYSHRH